MKQKELLKQKDGMRICNYMLRPNLGNKNSSSFTLITPTVFMPFEDVSSPRAFSRFIYNNYGASPQGVTYCIRYWKSISKMGKSIKKLAMIKLFEVKGNDKFRTEYIEITPLKKMKWFNSKGDTK
jgi:hypothetical protein